MGKLTVILNRVMGEGISGVLHIIDMRLKTWKRTTIRSVILTAGASINNRDGEAGFCFHKIKGEIKMKKLVMLLMLMPSGAFASNFMEVQMGYLNHGVRGGHSFNLLDVSAGYMNTVNDNSKLSSDVSIHTLDLSVGRNFKFGKVTAGVSGGIGYSIPNPDTCSDKADNGHSWVLGGGVEYPLIDDISIGLSVKSLFFTTDSHKVTFGSHTETLSNGQVVEIEDTYHAYDSVKLNTVIYALALKYRF